MRLSLQTRWEQVPNFYTRGNSSCDRVGISSIKGASFSQSIWLVCFLSSMTISCHLFTATRPVSATLHRISRNITIKMRCNNDPDKGKRLPVGALISGVGAVLLSYSAWWYSDSRSHWLCLSMFHWYDAMQQLAGQLYIEQECYAIYYAVRCFCYGTVLIIETDHNNLRWMEASQVPKIICWCAYLQSFQSFVHYIPGKQSIHNGRLSFSNTTAIVKSKLRMTLAYFFLPAPDKLCV